MKKFLWGLAATVVVFNLGSLPLKRNKKIAHVSIRLNNP